MGFPNGNRQEVWIERLQGLAAEIPFVLKPVCPVRNELDEDITPLEAGLGWTVKLEKPNFIGKAASSSSFGWNPA